MSQSKPFALSKLAVWRAYKKVKANRGGAGVDGQSIEEFEKNLVGNLYKLWNRMASGSYVPTAVRRVDIPKATSGTRPLGIPTVAASHKWWSKTCWSRFWSHTFMLTPMATGRINPRTML